MYIFSRSWKMGRTLFKQALCQWKVDGCLSGLSPFLGFCCFVVFLRFFLRHFSRICFFLGGDVDRILLGLDCVFGVWGWPIFYFFWILMVF
jgi:F0F1-type ATP synthase assembly protein I